MKALHFKATIDGNWVLMDFDKKNNRLSHRLEIDLPKGEHTFRLEVKDAVGNLTVFEKTFQR